MMPVETIEYYRLQRGFTGCLFGGDAYKDKRNYEDMLRDQWNHGHYSIVPEDCELDEMLSNTVVECLDDGQLRVSYFESERECKRYQAAVDRE